MFLLGDKDGGAGWLERGEGKGRGGVGLRGRWGWS